MEVCYDGALVMPSSYAVMDEEEMTYVEGGRIKVSTAAMWINGSIQVAIFMAGVGFGISSILWYLRHSVQGLVVASLRRALQSALVTFGFSCLSGAYGLLSTLNPRWSVGYGLARFMDDHESGKKRSNGYIWG